MYYRNVLTKMVNDETYVYHDKTYKFRNQYKQFWLDDNISQIQDEKFIELMKEKNMIKTEGPSCKIIQKDIINKLHIQLTDTCMCRCPHCYVGEGSKKSMRYEDVIEIIDDFIENGVTAVDYSGGEPTLHKDFARIISYGKSQGLRQMLFTNGYIREELYSTIKNNIDIIQVSIDGTEKYHTMFRNNDNVFQKALETLDKMQNTKIKKYVSMSVTNENVEHIPFVYRLAEEYGARFRISPPVPVGRYKGKDNNYYSKLLERIVGVCELSGIELTELKPCKPACSAIARSLYIDVNRNIYPCPLLSENKYLLGKYNKGGLERIYSEQKAITTRKEIDNTMDNKKMFVYYCPAFLFNLDCENGYFGEVKTCK